MTGSLITVLGFSVSLRLGVRHLTNLLFLMVTLLDPSTLIRTWEWGLFSRTIPLLSHLIGLFPVWFWMISGVRSSKAEMVDPSQ